MNLPVPSPRYDAHDQAATRRLVEQELARIRADVLEQGAGVFLRSPNGTRYLLTVSDAGALVVTAV